MSRWEDEGTGEHEFEPDEQWLCEMADEAYFGRKNQLGRRGARQRRDAGTGFDPFGYGEFSLGYCGHPPRCVLKNQDAGWRIYAGARGDCIRSLGKFDLLLNLTGSPVLGRHLIPIAALAHWEQPQLLPEIVLDWPDMGVVNLPRAFWVELIAHLERERASLLVFCVGGHGRTGTAIASLMTVCGWDAADAIAWVRANFCTRAIETKEQEAYVHRIGGESASPIQNRPPVRT